MGASVNMLLECLSAFGASAVSPLSLPEGSFSRAVLASASDSASRETVFVGSADELAEFGDIADGSLFVCIEQVQLDDLPSPGEVPANVVVVSNCNGLALVEYLNRFIMELNEWELRLVDCMFDGRGCVQCARLGREMLGRPLALVNPDFEVLASAGIEAGSPLASLVEDGCGDPQAIFEMLIPASTPLSALRGRSGAAGGATGPVAHAYAKKDDRALALVLMDCSDGPATPAEKDMLDRFACRLAAGLSMNRGVEGRRIKPSEKIELSVRFLLEGRGTESESLEMERRVAAALGGADEGCWVFVLESATGLPSEFVMSQVRSDAHGAICLLHEGRIVGVASRSAWKGIGRNRATADAVGSALASGGGNGASAQDGEAGEGAPSFDECTQSAFEVLEPIACRLGVGCGLSSPTVSAHRLDIAYAQAAQALSIGGRLCQSWNPFNSFRLSRRDVTAVRSYDELYLHVLCDAFSRTAPLESICHPELVRIMELDSQNGTDNYRVLYVLLENSMKIGETAKVLFMHRNNVRYRVNKIADQFGLDLESATERLRLRVTFRALDLLYERDVPNGGVRPVSSV